MEFVITVICIVIFLRSALKEGGKVKGILSNLWTTIRVPPLMVFAVYMGHRRGT